MNYYARAIEIIASKTEQDWFQMLMKIAATNPKALVDSLKPSWEKEAKELIDCGEKVAAIKLCRNATGLSLKEAKEKLDSLAYDPENHTNN